MIVFNQVHKQFGLKKILDNVSVSLNPKNRIGLIGSNGAGKTVLLRILTGEEDVDHGTVTIPAEIKIGYLPQEMDRGRSITPLDLVLEPFSHLIDNESVLEDMARCKDMESKEYKKAAKYLDAFHTELEIHDVHALPSRAKSILTGLGVPENSWNLDISNLSGGYFMRVILGQLLLIEPDFLLLDEPTNHLDMDSLIWLEKFLERFKGGMVIVSHDRDFLNRLTGHTMELTGGKVTQYSGSVDSYFTWKEEFRATEKRRVKNLQSKISKTEQFITRFKSKNTKASQARSKMKQLNRLRENLPEKAVHHRVLNFQFPNPSRSGSIPVAFDSVSVSYGEVPVFKKVSLAINRGDKIAIIGPNGAGKSTLLKTCLGSIKPTHGSVILGANTVVKYYSQHRLDQLDPAKTLFETVATTLGVNDKLKIQSILGAFLFSGDDVHKQVGIVSGGEKSRLSLALLLAVPGNLLLLDEPTNHLDMQSTECLADALVSFQGTILIVSHDEYFITRIANRLLEIRPGIIRDFPGSVTDYRSYIENGYLDILPSQISLSTTDKNTIAHSKNERIRKRTEKKKLERTIVKIEKESFQIEKGMEDLKKMLHDPANALDFQLLADTQQKLTEKKDEYNTLLHKWEIYQTEFDGFIDE